MDLSVSKGHWSVENFEVMCKYRGNKTSTCSTLESGHNYQKCKLTIHGGQKKQIFLEIALRNRLRMDKKHF